LTEDLLGGDFSVETPQFKDTRLFKALCLLIHAGAMLVVAYTISFGFWYLTVASNPLAQYSQIAETGRNLLFVGLFLTLFLFTGDIDVE